MSTPILVNLSGLNQDLDSLDWIEYNSGGRQGARIHHLYRDEETGQETALVHCYPGARAAPHIHLGCETIYVLEGSFQDEHGRYEKGQLVVFGEDSRHEWNSPEGGLMLLVRGGPVGQY